MGRGRTGEESQLPRPHTRPTACHPRQPPNTHVPNPTRDRPASCCMHPMMLHAPAWHTALRLRLYVRAVCFHSSSTDTPQSSEYSTTRSVRGLALQGRM